MNNKNALIVALLVACAEGKCKYNNTQQESDSIHFSTGFDYPVGNKNGEGVYKGTDGKVYDGWYVASGFLDESYKKEYGNYHPGEDWNGKGKGNTDLGQPVYSISEGRVIRVCNSHFFSLRKGKEVSIEHLLPDSTRVYSVYFHLGDVVVHEGEEVARRQKIGTIGTDYGKYLAHLHLEIRKNDHHCFYWPGGSEKAFQIIKNEYFNPSDFIRTHRSFSNQ